MVRQVSEDWFVDEFRNKLMKRVSPLRATLDETERVRELASEVWVDWQKREGSEINSDPSLIERNSSRQVSLHSVTGNGKDAHRHD
jgi:hypothetical protein